MIKFAKIKKKTFKILAKNMPINNIRVLLYKLCGYKIGKDVYIAEDFIVSEKLGDTDNLVIEDRVSIGPRVTLVTASDPNFSRIAPYVKVERGIIIIKKDAWIGACAVILPNVIIGEGAVVGANAVVTKNVEPFTVVAGVPAKVIRKFEVKYENSI